MCVGAGCGSSSSVVAHVGVASIDAAAVQHWSAVGVSSPRRLVDSRTRTRGALTLLISADQLLGEASTMQLEASNGEAEARLAEFEWDRARGLRFEPASRFAPFARSLLAEVGGRHADRLLLLRLDATAAKVERRLYSDAERGLGHAQIVDYYARHKGRYVLPERRDVEVVGSYERPIIMRAKQEIERGASFPAVAKRMSIDQEAPNGLEPHLARGEEEPDYDRVVFAAKPGRLYGPYKQAFFFIFRITHVTPTRQLSLEKAEAAIRRDIVNQEGKRIVDGFYHDLEHRWRARTSCASGYLVPGCRQYSPASTSHP